MVYIDSNLFLICSKPVEDDDEGKDCFVSTNF